MPDTFMSLNGYYINISNGTLCAISILILAFILFIANLFIHYFIH